LTDHVFGYASLVALRTPQPDAAGNAPRPGWLNGFRRHWGVAMNNWEGGETGKHFLDPESGERPRIRVAYLDLYPQPGSIVNGLALPVDEGRLEALDAREVNYERIDVSAAFEPPALGRVFAYVGLAAARERCGRGAVDGDVFVSSEYARGVRRAFRRLAPGALEEFERSTDPLPFPERDLRVVDGRY